MIEIQMTDSEFQNFMDGEKWYLSAEKGFDPYEQEWACGTQVLINGMAARVHIVYIDPPCSCCRGDVTAGDWVVTLA